MVSDQPNGPVTGRAGASLARRWATAARGAVARRWGDHATGVRLVTAAHAPRLRLVTTAIAHAHARARARALGPGLGAAAALIDRTATNGAVAGFAADPR